MKKLDYAIVFVADMSKAVAFYRDTLGLPLKYETPYWTEFANEGSTLALHPADAPSREGTSPSPTQTGAAVGAGLAPARNPAGSAQLGFVVPDSDAAHRELTAKGVKCLQPPKVQDFGGKLALYSDPDGFRFSVAEMPKK